MHYPEDPKTHPLGSSHGHCRHELNFRQEGSLLKCRSENHVIHRWGRRRRLRTPTTLPPSSLLTQTNLTTTSTLPLDLASVMMMSALPCLVLRSTLFDSRFVVSLP